MYKKQSKKAVDLLEAGIKSSGKNLGLLLDLAGLQEVSGNEQEAIQVYETILEKRPGAIQAVNNLAMLLIRRNQPEDVNQAYQLVKGIEKVTNPFYQDTIGWVKYKKGDLDAALQHIQVAAENAEINYHLGMVYQKRGNIALVKKHLETAVWLKKEFIGLDEAKRVLAML